MVQVAINVEALRLNFQALCQLVGGGAKLMAVVKSDGYGHGMVECANVLQSAGCRCFGVSSIEAGEALRRHGITGRIIIFLGGDIARLAEIQEFELEIVLYDEQQLQDFCQSSSAVNEKIEIHLKVDCGMGRLGFAPAQTFRCCEQLQETGAFAIRGIMSHLPCADSDLAVTLAQNKTFAGAVELVKSSGAKPQAHIANSAALLADSALHWDLVRPGLALYGCYPSANPEQQRVALVPVMTASTIVIQVKDVPSGTGISYGLIQHTRRPSRLAVIEVGYSDGYARSLSGVGQVLVHGQRAPIIGRVCMGMVVVDVTDIIGVRRGDDVVLLGKQGDEAIHADEIAGWLDTISYEVLCMFGKNMKRSYVND